MCLLLNLCNVFNLYISNPLVHTDKKINFFAISFRYNDIIHRSSMLSIPLIKCDDQVFIKEEIIEEIDHNKIGYELNWHNSIILNLLKQF